MRKRLIEVESAAMLALVGKALDCMRSAYDSPRGRRMPLVREVDLTSKPLRVERRAGARRSMRKMMLRMMATSGLSCYLSFR